MNPLNDETLIANRIAEIYKRIEVAACSANRRPSDISVMAVTKTIAPEMVNFAIRHGVFILGENRVQELLEKHEQYFAPRENIHFIGHLQSNKVKYIIDKVGMIETVDSISIASEINLKAKQANIIMPVLLQVNISKEETKSGFTVNSVDDSIKLIRELENVSLKGMMCIPQRGNSLDGFKAMEDLFFNVNSKSSHRDSMDILSMGMSDDYEAAIKHHSNLIRLGSAIFGKRDL